MRASSKKPSARAQPSRLRPGAGKGERSPRAAEASAIGARPNDEGERNTTRRALLDAARVEFAERGFDSPSLDSICARAGFTRGAFYVHFKTREDLVVAVLEQELGAVVLAVLGSSSDADRGLPEIFSAFVGELEARRASTAAPRIKLHQLLQACERSKSVRCSLERLIDVARRGLHRAMSGEEAPNSGAQKGAAVDVLLPLSLGLLAMNDLGLSTRVERVRRALLEWLAPPGR